jgi:hypothetical protein
MVSNTEMVTVHVSRTSEKQIGTVPFSTAKEAISRGWLEFTGHGKTTTFSLTRCGLLNRQRVLDGRIEHGKVG